MGMPLSKDPLIIAAQLHTLRYWTCNQVVVVKFMWQPTTEVPVVQIVTRNNFIITTALLYLFKLFSTWSTFRTLWNARAWSSHFFLGGVSGSLWPPEACLGSFIIEFKFGKEFQNDILYLFSLYLWGNVWV